MNRSDQRREMKGGVSDEKDDPIGHEEGEDSSMARSRGAAHAGAETHAREEKSIERSRGDDEVRGGKGIERSTVDADHVIGAGGPVGTKSAEGDTDMASAKANRKEAMEPEREDNEKAAMGRERTVPTKNTMGHGQRETVGKHTI